MGDSDQRPSPAPESQHDDATPVDSESQPEAQLDIARRFLNDDEIRSSPRDKKVEFLKSKGINEADIALLLQETDTESVSDTDSAVDTPGSSEISIPSTPPPTEKAAAVLPTSTGDRPPIVTYPEFLAKPARPPPLVTTNRLLHTLNGIAVLSAALYGVSRFIVNPMVDSLTAARTELHATTADKLDGIVAKLEQTVSVVPPPRVQPGAIDALDDAEDPAEMFHRDVGTQTSALPSPSPAADQSPADPAQKQTDTLASLVRSLSVLRDDYRTQSESFEDVKSLVDVFRDDLDAMTYGSTADFVGGYDMYNMRRKNEPEDEIKKVRDNIRRVKGVLLSTRNFPTSARRQ